MVRKRILQIEMTPILVKINEWKFKNVCYYLILPKELKKLFS